MPRDSEPRPLDFSVRNNAFTFIVKACTDDARAAFAEFRPDLERERDGRLALSADELAAFEEWVRERGLSSHVYMEE